MIRVGMRYRGDCLVCALAAALEISWADTAGGFPKPWWRDIGGGQGIANLHVGDVIQFLERRRIRWGGKVSAAALRHRGLELSLPGMEVCGDDAAWPPEAFAPVHVLFVKTPNNGDEVIDGRMVYHRHCVAWDGKTVFDSLHDGPRRLEDYPNVELVLGIHLPSPATATVAPRITALGGAIAAALGSRSRTSV